MRTKRIDNEVKTDFMQQIREAAQRDYVEPQYHLGRILYANGRTQDLLEAVLWLTKATLQGHIEAQVLLENINKHYPNIVLPTVTRHQFSAGVTTETKTFDGDFDRQKPYTSVMDYEPPMESDN